jgi:CRP/FNR family transcriptional regulator, nitrogen oxide reductase regulator
MDASYLAEAELFKGLDPSVLAAISEAARRRNVRAGAYLFRQGDEAGMLYVLVRGSVKLTQITPEGDQVLLRVVGAGETFGATAPLAGGRYPASAQAASACQVLVWDGPTMLDLMERFPRLAINALKVLAERVHEFQDRYREMATERVERRVARALLRLARQVGRRVEGGVLIDLTLSRQDLAEMTGTKRFTVSRIFSDWEERGLIEAGRERVLIKQPHGLVVIAEDLPPYVPVEDEE